MGSSQSEPLSDTAKDIGQYVPKAFQDHSLKSPESCFTCTSRPKTYVKSVTIFERDADKNRYATTVDLLHEKDAATATLGIPPNRNAAFACGAESMWKAPDARKEAST
eukprot:CAMPEP_0181448972 /NCGR_PEP_ID=MMETSP1110-20121109/27415_1 /TAXON_ID=174948 /ORGANISM="Symbiodinium sp., Strain CCMP421" /LENGTH=107 /DNA_ID=CAMNT_0023573137 /DNA_START=33 /DNA_END=357 /DNA_ORIENTATION=-